MAMMTGRVLLVCALYVLWCGAGGVGAEGQEAGTLSPPPGPVYDDQGGVLSGIGRMKPSDTDGQVTVDGVRDRAESKHLSSRFPLVDAKDVTPDGIGGEGNGAVDEVAPEENESLQNSCDEDGERSEGCVQVQGGDGFPGNEGGHVDRGRQQDNRNPLPPLSDQTSSEEINSPLPAERNPHNQRPVSRQAPVVVEKQTDPVSIRPQKEAATLESEAVRNAANSHSQESAAELTNGTLPAHARVTEAEDRSKNVFDTHKDAAEKQKKPAHTTGKSESPAASGDAHKATASTAAVDNEAAIKKAKSPGGASSPISISDNSNNDTEQNNARDTSEEASHSTENATTHSAGIPRAPHTTAKTDDTTTQEDSNSDGGTVKMGEAAPQTAGTAQANDTATHDESDSSTAVSHTTSPLFLLLLVACAAAAAVVAA
ncbi:Mucin-associated surface protein (MASP) [Trypanosoma cruzi]|uniref:Mucin-associated surface protein (MASP) n=1 Tax=Trypanosoma cruzi TaxID=5693 RepID=A0A2V2WAS4_TRYCR|nr:Mucin-associated surface protein (MASP) [Trypanosoma cruzi]